MRPCDRRAGGGSGSSSATRPDSGDPRINVLVTGAAGFIGSHLCEVLLARGVRVIGVDAFTSYYDPALKRQNVDRLRGTAFDFIEGDLASIDLDRILSEGIDHVVHLAGQPGVRLSWGSDFAEYTRQNIDATQRLLDATNRHDVSRFIYASSSSVYGQAETYPTDESMVPSPFSPYGVTKLAGEHLVGAYASNYGLAATSFRFFTVYGPRQRPDMAFTRFLKAAIAHDELVIYGDGTQVRDFTHVSDICEAIVAALEASGDLPGVMNLAGGSSVSVLEVLDTIESLGGRPLSKTFVPKVSGDVQRTGGSITLASQALGWQPRVPLADGLRDQYEWVRGLAL